MTMKKTYIIPTCKVYNASTAPLCASISIQDVYTSDNNGSWSKSLGEDLFGDSKNSADNSFDLID